MQKRICTIFVFLFLSFFLISCDPSVTPQLGVLEDVTTSMEKESFFVGEDVSCSISGKISVNYNDAFFYIEVTDNESNLSSYEYFDKDENENRLIKKNSSFGHRNIKKNEYEKLDIPFSLRFAQPGVFKIKVTICAYRGNEYLDRYVHMYEILVS